MALRERCEQLIKELGLGEPSDVTDVSPLTGGVASDIAMVALQDRRLCVKFALPKLKVRADWFAPVHRNAAEYAWLEVASHLLPESAVKLYGRSEKEHGFAMEFIEGDDVYLWKEALLAGASPKEEAKQVATMLGTIHAASTQPDFNTAYFQNRDDFHALRIEPYLLHTAKQHPHLHTPLKKLADGLYDQAKVLLHGDASPKNILFRKDGPVLLDAECATMGDASFDPSFCLNHLVLKAAHLPTMRTALLESVIEFWDTYKEHVTWEEPEDLEARICRLLPALMLARIDGKSPVEYLTDEKRTQVCQISISLIEEPSNHLAEFNERVHDKLREEDS